MGQRIWMDSYEMRMMYEQGIETLPIIGDLFNAGHILVTDSTHFLDIKVFQERPDWACWCLEDGNVIIESDELHKKINIMPNAVQERRFWFSCLTKTLEAPSLEEAVSVLPNQKDILELKERIEKFVIPSDKWQRGDTKEIEEVLRKRRMLLGVSERATRTEALTACEKLQSIELYEGYNRDYIKYMAIMHRCKYVLIRNGNLLEV